jgi:predicted HTH transcriptional regulator
MVLHGTVIFTFSGLEQIDEKDYPDAAIREVLLNAVVHF